MDMNNKKQLLGKEQPTSIYELTIDKSIGCLRQQAKEELKTRDKT